MQIENSQLVALGGMDIAMLNELGEWAMRVAEKMEAEEGGLDSDTLNMLCDLGSACYEAHRALGADYKGSW